MIHTLPFSAKLCFAAVLVSTLVPVSAGAQSYSVIYRFQGNLDGANPQGDLAADSSGNIYGVTSGGGSKEFGQVFELTAPFGTWQKIQLYSFQGGSDGQYPVAGVVRDSAGNLYGPMQGSNGLGAIFELSPPGIGQWVNTILHTFTGGADGGKPQGRLLLKNGSLIGTTFSGGAFGVGLVFVLKPPSVTGGPWTERVLYNFTGGSDGANPWPGVTLDKLGNLYGVTESAGANGNGTVYELSPPTATGQTWTETTLHSFGPTEGENPVGELLVDRSGNVYGMTSIGPPNVGVGGGYGCGVVFQLVPPLTQGADWVENLLYTFTGANDGCNPYSGLVLDSSVGLLGANSGDSGLNGDGAIFRLSPAASGFPWHERTIHSFTGGTDGEFSYSTFLRSQNGAYFGTTSAGGSTNSYGTIFQIEP
jgi:hypothetical protein